MDVDQSENAPMVCSTCDRTSLSYFLAKLVIRRTRANVPPLVQVGRARWKVENENTNVLKTKGYHVEHNYGHGSRFLSTTLLTLNLLAFLAHTFLEVVDTQYRTIRHVLSARKTFFHDFTTLTKYFFFDSWSHLIAFMAEQLEIEPANTG
jgi:hypothetical protein